VTVVVVWIAVALTGWGPVVGQFADERACRQAVELGKVCSSVDAVSECVPVEVRGNK
jgi:F420-dependent methylenetetrahydromethanopterin dehydrogenase